MAAKLTSHQADVLHRVGVRAKHRFEGWVDEHEVGSHSGCWHLVAKGYLEADEVIGPRGGRSYRYRPTQLGWLRVEARIAKRVAAHQAKLAAAQGPLDL